MTITQKVTQSAQSFLFTFHKEGIFYKCYNEDAMLFSQKVKEYKVSSKFVKGIDSIVHSIGFPTREVEKGTLSFDNISTKIGAKSFEEKNEIVVFNLIDKESKKGYNQWLGSLQSFSNNEVEQESGSYVSNMNNTESILALIKKYDLANNTPMQGLNFIQELKNLLNKFDK